MIDIKCNRCGALTVGVAQICRFCEIELNPIRPWSAGSILFHTPQSAVGSNPPVTSSPTIGPFNGVSDVLGPTLVLFTKNFWLITKLTLVIVVPFEIFQALSVEDIIYDWQLSAGIYVLDLLCTVLTAPALIYALMQVMHTGTAPGINESYRWGFTRLWKLTITAAIAWILTMLGFMLCFIPGILVGLALTLVFPIAILEKGSPVEILHSSMEMTKGHRWKILVAYIVVLLLTLLFSVPAETLGVGFIARDFDFWPLHAAGAIFSDIMHQSGVVLSLVIYLSIRALWSQSTQ